MMVFLAVASFLAGIILIVKGGDVFVDAAGWVSDVTGISKVVIGATIVSFATTSPEYFVSLIATLKGLNDLSIGNAVGSLIANLGLAFAMLAIFTPGKVDDRLYGLKGCIMIATTALLLLFCLNGAVSAGEGAILLLIFLFFTLINIRYSKDGEERRRKETNPGDIAVNAAKFVGGAAAIVFGSNLIVDNGQFLAAFLGVSEAVIGLTVVAVGTSLPEVVTSAAAIIKKQNALSIGNIVGANILDATLILATGAFVSGGRLAVSAPTVRIDLPMTLLLMAIAVFPTAVGKKIYRWQGLLLAGCYGAYLIYVAVAA